MKDKRIKIMLINLDITHRALGRMTDIQESKISLYANGLIPSVTHRAKISKALGIPVNDLWPAYELNRQ
jgi:hypothetical protein